MVQLLWLELILVRSQSIDFMHVHKNKTPNICSLAEQVENKYLSAQLVTASHS